MYEINLVEITTINKRTFCKCHTYEIHTNKNTN